LKHTIAAFLSGAAFLASSGMVATEKRVTVTGIYSDMEYVEETGDLVGTEIFLLLSGEGHFVLVQVAEGSPGVPLLLPARVDGQSLTFELPECGKFTGQISAGKLVGSFANCSNWHVRLNRKRSYWQR
jgi:hypothetical protein